MAPRTNRVVVVVKGPEWTVTWEEASGSVFLRVWLSFFSGKLSGKRGNALSWGVSESEGRRRCEKPEMRCFPRLESLPGSVAPRISRCCHYHYKSTRLSASPNQLRHPTSPYTPDKDVPLFPVRPPNAPPARTNNTTEAQLVPTQASKGGRCLSPPRPLLPILLRIFLPNLSICRHRRQSPRPRLSLLSCSRPYP